jgi:hypothetical protein
MRFLRRSYPSMLQLVSNAPAIDKTFWCIEYWHYDRKPQYKFICDGSFGGFNKDRFFRFGFGSVLSLRYYESLSGKDTVMWIANRALTFHRKRTHL